MIKIYYKLNDFLEMIDEPNRSSCRKIYLDNKKMFDKSKGSNVKHHSWVGGYIEHVEETMNIGINLYNTLNGLRKLDFSLSDVLILLFLHDLEKPWKYAGTEKESEYVRGFSDYNDFIKEKINEYNFKLSDYQLKELKYIHGEGDDYDPNRNIQGPLSAFIHTCDVLSARVWHEFPKEKHKW